MAATILTEHKAQLMAASRAPALARRIGLHREVLVRIVDQENFVIRHTSVYRDAI